MAKSSARSMVPASSDAKGALGSLIAGEPIDRVRVYSVMKPPHYISEKKAVIAIWIGTALFTIGAMIFGH
jgi:hypothetical protein